LVWIDEERRARRRDVERGEMVVVVEWVEGAKRGGGLDVRDGFLTEPYRLRGQIG
jgi:hypothetical protein